MDKTETTEAIAAIGMMLKAFPSAQSSITEDSPKVYLFAVEEYSLEALKRACRSIVRGGVKDLKPDFPPAAPKLAQIVKDCEAVLKVERYEAEHIFIEKYSDTWAKLSLLRKDNALMEFERTLPNVLRVRGWFFKPDEVAEAEKLQLPPPIPEVDAAQRRADIAARGIPVGDIEGAAV
jgi:hypothetical protein